MFTSRIARSTTVFPIMLVLLVTIVLVGPPAAAPAHAQEENACLVLALDQSGSMVENDPGFLRNTGAKLFISLLDDGDRVGVVRFATGAARLTPELVTLQGPEDKRALLDLLQDEAADGYTDMKAALGEATALLLEAGCASRTIVLLSDGQPELAGGLPAGYEQQTLELVEQLNAPVFGIALTVEGESGLLYQLAAATNPPGVVIPARSASDLLDAYLEVLARLKDRTVIGSGFSNAPGATPLPLDAGLAQYVSRATYIVSKPDGVGATLVAPGGRTLQESDPLVQFAYTADPDFAVYTVDAPAPREWAFQLSGSGQVQARAILRSRLRVESDLPPAYQPQGEPMPLAVRLIEEERDGTVTTLIGQASFSVFILRPDGSQEELDQLYDDGGNTPGVASGDARAGDGLFSNLYVNTDLEGEYRLTITGYKGVIPVSRSLRVVVVPFPRIAILQPDAPQMAFRGEPLPLGLELVGGSPPALDSGGFTARIADPTGNAAEVDLVEANGQWTSSFVPAVDGIHTIDFLPQHATYKGVPYTLSARRGVEISLIPSLSLTLGKADLRALETHTVAEGIAVELRAISSSRKPEPVDLTVVGVPGLQVTGISPAEVPSGESKVYLMLQGNLPPDDYEATLLVTAREGVDLARRELPLSFTVYRPALAVEPQALQVEVRQDRQGRDELFLTITSESQRDERIVLSWEGQGTDLLDLDLVADPVVVPAGATAEAPFHFEGNLPEGQHEGRILLTGRNGLDVEPAVVPVTLSVTPVPWCARWCLPLGGAALALAIASGIIVSRLRNRPRPWGQLKVVKTPPGQKMSGFIPLASGLLTADRCVIGSGRADIRLQGGGVESRHAAVKTVQRTQQEKTPGRPPKFINVQRQVNLVQNLGGGRVQVDGVPVAPGTESAPLRGGSRLVIGDYEFIYHA